MHLDRATYTFRVVSSAFDPTHLHVNRTRPLICHTWTWTIYSNAMFCAICSVSVATVRTHIREELQNPNEPTFTHGNWLSPFFTVYSKHRVHYADNPTEASNACTKSSMHKSGTDTHWKSLIRSRVMILVLCEWLTGCRKLDKHALTARFNKSAPSRCSRNFD